MLDTGWSFFFNSKTWTEVSKIINIYNVHVAWLKSLYWVLHALSRDNCFGLSCPSVVRQVGLIKPVIVD